MNITTKATQNCPRTIVQTTEPADDLKKDGKDNVKQSPPSKAQGAEKTEGDWGRLIERMSSEKEGEVRLLFLSPLQLLAFWKVFTEASKAKNEERYAKHYLMPYLIQCFPDHANKLYGSILAIKTALKEKEKTYKASDSPEEMIAKISEYIKWVKYKLKIKDEFAAEEKAGNVNKRMLLHILNPNTDPKEV